MTEDLGQEIIIDLFRSAWLVEAGRAKVFEHWAEQDPRFAAHVERANERARIAETNLAAHQREPDRALMGAHIDWIESLIGSRPDQTPFADIFLVRLGDWVAAHAAVLYEHGADRVAELAQAEQSDLQFPEELPAPPPPERLDVPDLAPPGEPRFRFGILGDLHVGSDLADDTARAAVRELNESGAELVIQLGDITDHGNAAEFESAVAILNELQMPCYTMMGNHDVYSVAEERLSGREYYPAHFGREPDGILAEHKGFRFAVLDSVEHGASPFAPFDLVTGTFAAGPGGAIVRGALTPAQHDILAEVAAAGAPPAFVFLHHPPQPFTAFPPVLFGLRDQDSGRLQATADSGNVWGVFAGHTHRNARSRTYEGVPVQEVGIARDFPCGYALIDVGDSGYAYRFVQIGDQDLLGAAHGRAGVIWRRYARGRSDERSFVWAPNRRKS